ncbi:MAG: four helix bundle protein [Prevotella sp.]|nr:four helix bundle protein [Prevotella sp.]
MSKTFEDVLAWQKAHSLVLSVYRITKAFPTDERRGLTSQFQRAAVSIAANIAEGYGKLSRADKLRFLNIAQGSLEESRYYCILSRDLGYISFDAYNDLRSQVNEVSFFLNAYIKGINENKYNNSME